MPPLQKSFPQQSLKLVIPHFVLAALLSTPCFFLGWPHTCPRLKLGSVCGSLSNPPLQPSSLSHASGSFIPLSIQRLLWIFYGFIKFMSQIQLLILPSKSCSPPDMRLPKTFWRMACPPLTFSSSYSQSVHFSISIVTPWIHSPSRVHPKYCNKSPNSFADSCPPPIHSSPISHSNFSQTLKFCPSPAPTVHCWKACGSWLLLLSLACLFPPSQSALWLC